ncbi:MAG: phosphoribosylanthranilate isomerase [Bacteroidales bacterium]|nr:phosphoribosylanthranilate isomerase [Bacteroidales bacterium]MCF8389485.1 phosphoribosylanthranilate isomerase [Bacteroidales bacterium]
MKIKICGIANSDNLKEIIKLKPDFLGFIFYPPSPRYVKNKLVPADLQCIPELVKKTGVFVDSSVNEVEEIVSSYQLNYIQLHGNESVEYCSELASGGYKILKAFRIHQDFNFEIIKEYIPFCEYFLFDTLTRDYGGSGKKFNWEILKSYKFSHPFLLSGGIGLEDTSEIQTFNHPSFAGIDLNSRFELKPGIKDVNKLDKFIQSVRE